MRHSVTTPGGFFIGLGGIAASLFVAYAVYSFVKKPATGEEYKAQQIALKLAVPPDAAPGDATNKLKKDIEETMKGAAAKYNGGIEPNLNDLEDLRGVVRYREAKKSVEDAEATLHAKSKEEGKTVLDVAMLDVAGRIQQKPVKASAVKVDIFAPPEVIMPPSLPNLTGGGVNTVVFPEIKPPAPAAPAPAPGTAPAPPAPAAHGPAPAPAAPAPVAPTTPPPAAATPPAAVPAPSSPAAPAPAEPNRPPLLNGTEPTK